MKKLTKPQVNMLVAARDMGCVMTTAGKPTAWILERAGLLRNVQRWERVCCTPGLIKYTYEYELHLTDKGRAKLDELQEEHRAKKKAS